MPHTPTLPLTIASTDIPLCASPDAGEAALVIFSGGQDSATCLAWALNRFSRVFTLGFDYGQRHQVELACREHIRSGLATLNTQWALKLGPDTLLHLDALRGNDSALTSNAPIVEGHGDAPPNTFVPGRNLFFMLHAAVHGYAHGIRHLVLGVCDSDYSGYPDCRDDSIKAMQVALNLGMDARFSLHTPLMRLTKHGAWELAESLGGPALVDLLLEKSHTCYEGERGSRHSWGYGCGKCPACLLRATGYAAYVKACGQRTGQRDEGQNNDNQRGDGRRKSHA